MVSGFESFREHFAGYEDCYTIIGGTGDVTFAEVLTDYRRIYGLE